MKPLTIGILPQQKIRARTLAIAKGEYHPKPGEPKIWFTSLRSLVQSDVNTAHSRFRYAYFQIELRSEREVRDKLYKAFDDDAKKEVPRDDVGKEEV